MITEFLMWVLSGVPHLLALAIGLIPLPDPDPILGAVSGSIGSVFAGAASLSYWLPFGAAGAAVLTVAAVLVAAFGIKAFRMAASFITGGGGSAA